MLFSRNGSVESRSRLTLAVLCALIAVGAMTASAAQAQPWLEWYVSDTQEGPLTHLNSSEAVKCSTSAGMAMTVPISKTTTVTANFTNASCEESTIYNGSENGKGYLRFALSGGTVTGAKAGCTASFAGTLLKSENWADATIPSGFLRPFTPVSETKVGSFTLKTTCGAIAGNYPLKGMFSGENKYPNGVRALDFSSLRFNQYTKRKSELTYQERPVELGGELTQELVSGKWYTTQS